MKYQPSKKVILKDNADFNEKRLQDIIAESPEILGLGENIEVKDIDHRQSSGGRLDMLLFDTEKDNKRYTVELQLGKCDPDHIIRTIEYWDLERKRYPNHEYCAVIVAEEITSRFWNIINLFNRSIPLIAIQLDAREVNGVLTLNFIKVLDEINFGDSEDDEKSEPADRAYWERKSQPEILALVDFFEKSLNKFFPDIELNYNKSYIGIKKQNKVDNAIHFCPYQNYMDLKIKTNRVSEKIVEQLKQSEIVSNWRGETETLYRARVCKSKEVLEKNLPLLESLFKEAYKYKEPLQQAS